MLTSESTSIEDEVQARLDLWAELNQEQISPALLREQRIYAGQRGIYMDADRTKALTGGSPVTMSLLHTGTSYPDDLSADGVIYHYPETMQTTRDASEVAATKAASLLGVPVFTISPGTSGLRSLHLSWVEGWDDDEKWFFVSFGDQPPTSPAMEEDDPEDFDLFAEIERPKREVAVRPGQQRFRFQVFQRYGSKCAVCSIVEPQLLQAAHLVPVSAEGSFDPRNGLVLCYTHHRALDVGLFRIDPESTELRYPEEIADSSALGIQEHSLTSLPNQPHQDALHWLWRKRSH